MINLLTDLASSILAIKSDAQVSIIDEDINQITWHDGNPTNITNEQILAKQTELQAEYDAQDYARKRKEAYPDIYDYMDGIVKNDQTQINKYIADSQAVKARYPKGA
tara:strand:+ start:679 stop:999 length:321 start_codon:yes stop_codon:yes gene_type:complete